MIMILHKNYIENKLVEESTKLDVLYNNKRIYIYFVYIYMTTLPKNHQSSDMKSQSLIKIRKLASPCEE